MKRNLLILTSIALLSVTFYSCSDNAAGKTATAAPADSSSAAKDSVSIKQTAVVYTCKMHPEVISDKPGKCPKCGMDLVKKDSTKH